MSAHRFAIDRPVTVGQDVVLRGEEGRHARVRRLAIGEPVVLFDGAGHSWLGAVCGAGRDGVRVRVTAARPDGAGESPLDLTLAVALLKSDKLDWVIEKATELGVSRLRPFASAHSLAQPSANRLARWQQLARAAAKQCGRSAVPAVAAPCMFAELFARPAAARLLLAEHGETVPLASLPLDRPASVLLAIGPEGGFEPAELADAHAAGFTLVGLGPRILRAETAAITAVALCQSRWGDLSL